MCKIDRFDTLLKLKFPTESRKHLEAMVGLAAARAAAEEAARQELQAVENDVAAIFAALDTDGDGTIDLEEFLRLDTTTGLPKERLEVLFAERDEDKSGDLTLDEFRAMACQHRLFDHKGAIIHLGVEAKKEREIAPFCLVNLCRESGAF